MAVRLRSSISGVYWAVLPMLLVLFVKYTDSLECLECNAYFQGRRGTGCDEPLNRTECAACMKVTTKIKLHDGWLIRRTSEVETKYCARIAGSPGLKEEGCYIMDGNGGYTESCFCYSNYCNKVEQLRHSFSLWIYVVFSLGLCALLRR